MKLCQNRKNNSQKKIWGDGKLQKMRRKCTKMHLNGIAEKLRMNEIQLHNLPPKAQGDLGWAENIGHSISVLSGGNEQVI